MAVEFKDYYQVLGVDRKASEDEIRKSFRKLARQYHPDVAKGGGDSEAKFKEINEAYEVLSDPEKRKKYDKFGANWQHGDAFEGFGGMGGMGQGGGRSYRVDPRGFEFGGTGFSDFFEAFFGSGAAGAGFGGMGPDGVGGMGGMSGRAARHTPPARDVHADIMVTLEEALKGSTRTVTLRRKNNLTGQPQEPERYQVKIPAGVREGQQIRMAGQGERGQDGKAGDLFLRVRLERHPLFEVDGSDLVYDLALAPWHAVLGTQVTIPTLDGKVSLKIPAGMATGRRLRLRGQGLPSKSGRGDLHVVVTIETPTDLTPPQRDLWEKLREASR